MTKVKRPADRRSTSNRNARGGSEDRRKRKAWLIETYRADVDMPHIAIPLSAKTFDEAMAYARLVEVPFGEGIPAARCYRCGTLVTAETVICDRIIPGCLGGTYRRNNIRPSCQTCSELQGGEIGVRQRGLDKV